MRRRYIAQGIRYQDIMATGSSAASVSQTESDLI
jgi:hypothetical protein